MLVVAFIASVAASAAYLAQRPTVARGDVLAADLLEHNGSSLRAIDCDAEIPVGVDGATFWCRAHFVRGSERRLQFHMDRAGAIHQTTESEHVVNKADPWQ